MEKQPLVSVVVPVYNVEKYLEECLESIIKQTLSDIEIICVNDGSKDNSLKILERFAALDERVKVITKENSGYGHTMNVGMDAARGRYFGIVESDDYIDEDMYRSLYEKAEETQADAVKSDYYKLSTLNGKKSVKKRNTCYADFFYDRILSSDEYEEVFDFEMMNWTGIFRMDFLRKNNIRFNETPGASFQDNGFWFRTIYKAKRLVYINKAFYYYRQDNPESSINSKEKVNCMFEEYDHIKRLMLDDPDASDELHTVFLRKKFYNLRHSWERVDRKYKLDHLRKEREEYKKDLRELRCRRDKLDPWVVGEINKIIDSPEMYYYEVLIGKLERRYDKVHDDLMKLRRSEDFNRGLNIRGMLKERLRISPKQGDLS